MRVKTLRIMLWMDRASRFKVKSRANRVRELLVLLRAKSERFYCCRPSPALWQLYST